MRWLKKYWLELCLVLPMTAYILGFTMMPIIRTILLGFQDRFSGKWSLNTYRELFGRPDFVSSIRNTFVIAFISLFFQMIIAFIIASALKRKFKGRGLVRSLVLMPMGVPTLVSGIIALYVFGNSGYFNELLYRLNIISTPVEWLTGNLRGLFVVAAADTWKVLPTLVLLLLAGLESISQEMYEAASIDGASKWQALRYITLPMLKATTTMAVLLRAVDVFRIFELPQVLVGKAMPFVATYAYEEYNLGNPNGSGAASTVLLIMILSFAFIWLKYIDRGDGFNSLN